MKAPLSPPRTPVLFVDDSALARVAVTRRLVGIGIGIEVVTLASAAEAKGAHGAAFAAALLDIELGDGFGTEVALHLQTSAPNLPIAFFTAGAPAEILAAAAQIGPVFSKTSELDDAVRWIAETIARG